MLKRTKGYSGVAILLLIVSACSNVLGGASKPELRLALDNLADDDRDWNCHEAMYFLYLQRDEIKDFLMMNAPALAWQGQEAVLRILCEVSSFVPDEKFARLMLERLHDQRELGLRPHHSTHYDFIMYLQLHAERFAELLASQISSDSLFVQWVATHILSEANLLDQYRDRYTQEVIARVVSNLSNDDVSYNGAFAVRICLVLGEQCLPVLQKALADGDSQSKRLASLLVEVIVTKSDRARGDINVICPIESSVMKQGYRPLSEILIHRTPSFLEKK